MEWVRLPHYCKTTGECVRSFHRWKAAGEFFEGIHYQLDSHNRVWVNTEAMTAWLLGKRPKKSRRIAA